MDEPLLGASAIEKPAEFRGRPQKESVDSSEECELNSFEAFRRYCINANIALVRPEFLEKLCQEGRVWPRRQEAEQIPGALYKPGPDDEFSFIGISHCWESREHPDPFGYQLKTIVDAWHYWQEVDPEVYGDDTTYFFIDYMSLPQFKRSAEEQTCFQRAMKNMHLFYANSGAPSFCKRVWRLEDLTPASVKRQQIRQRRTIPVYILAEGKVVEVPLKRLKRSIGGKCSSSCDESCRNLHANEVIYLGRGWCRAEYEWAKPYTINISRRGVCLRCCWAQYDALFHRLSLPWTPEAFQRSVAAHALKFTHRGDIDPVLELQRTVFQQKVVTLENFLCTWLPCHEVDDLVELVGLLTAVQSFALTAAHVAESQQVALATALETRPALQTVKIFSVQLSPGAVQVLTAAPQLRTLELNACGLGDAGAGAVATALAQHPTLREVNLLFNAIGSHGATALAKALVTNDVLELLDLAGQQDPLPRRSGFGRGLAKQQRLETLGDFNQPDRLPGRPSSEARCREDRRAARRAEEKCGRFLVRMDVLHPDSGLDVDLHHHCFAPYQMLQLAAEDHRLHQHAAPHPSYKRRGRQTSGGE
ncbi:Protein NLRC3 [Durusdinium trenchii]|uniref:Protein NLRC3 n=2 Tax=Durusdinium trenchii TaxID=1381693 RepID=A0ABP0ID59_9DINO